MGARTKDGEASFLGNMHPALFAMLCLLAALCGGASASFLDLILIGANGSAGNFATSAIFMIVFLVGMVSPPAVLIRTRRQARVDRDRMKVVEPVLAERPVGLASQEPNTGPKEQQDPQVPQSEPQTATSAVDQRNAPPAKAPLTLRPLTVEPIFVARQLRSGSGILVATALILAAFVGGILMGGKELGADPRELTAHAVDRLRDFAHAVGIDVPNQAPTPDSAFASLYKRLGIEPLPANLERQAEINRGLTRLHQEACDKQAIFSLENALRQSGNARIAANALLGYAATCANGEGDRYAAANILYQLADYDQVIMIMNEMIAARPALADYRYLRGEALVGAKRYEEALTDYASTIELFGNQHNVGEWVFLEMAAAYASLKQYCAAITPIQTYVAIDPPNRDTPRARKLISDYSKQGACDQHYATGTDTFPHDNSNVIRTRVSVNGVEGTFLLDTGASFVVVTSDFAMRAKVDVARQSVPVDTANGRTESTLGHAASVRVGRRIEATDVPILIQSRALGSDVDGLLGMSFLSRFNLSIGKRDWTLSPKK